MAALVQDTAADTREALAIHTPDSKAHLLPAGEKQWENS